MVIFIPIIPALAMKSFAGNNKMGTLQCFFFPTFKISKSFLGGFFLYFWSGFYVCCLHWFTSILFMFGSSEGNLDLGATLGSYFGLIILIATFFRGWDL